MSVQPARSREVAVTFLRSLEAEPWRFDYFTVLRHLERTYKDSPRISDSAARREEYVQFGQDPYMEFPASNLARAVQGDNQPLKLFVKFLGLLGPQGALPLATTEEAHHFVLAQDDAFSRFLDIFNNRFIQLFFRAWADSPPIVQNDRPHCVFFYRGHQLDGDTELATQWGAVEPIKLGRFGQLGWTSWMAPNWTLSDEYRRDARFHPAERMRHKRGLESADDT